MTIISTFCDWCGRRMSSLPAVRHNNTAFCCWEHYMQGRERFGLTAANEEAVQ